MLSIHVSNDSNHYNPLDIYFDSDWPIQQSIGVFYLGVLFSGSPRQVYPTSIETRCGYDVQITPVDLYINSSE